MNVEFLIWCLICLLSGAAMGIHWSTSHIVKCFRENPSETVKELNREAFPQTGREDASDW